MREEKGHSRYIIITLKRKLGKEQNKRSHDEKERGRLNTCSI